MKGIYKITNPLGEVYIGQSRDIDRRRYQYSISSAHKQTRLQNSLNIYGWSSHNFEILFHLCDGISQENLNYWEIFFIKYFLDFGSPMLNMKHGGAYGVYSSETKTKMSQTAKDRLGNPLNNPFFRKKHTEEAKSKMRAKKLGRKLTYYAKEIALKNLTLRVTVPIVQYSIGGEFIKEWSTKTAAAKSIGKSITYLTKRIENGAVDSGFKWSKKQE